MVTAIVPTVTAMEAQAEASLFLIDRLPDRISASAPFLDEAIHAWRVPVILAYPQLGVLGQIEVVVSATTTEIVSFTAIDEMLTAAQALAEQHRDAIEAPLPPA